MSDLALLTQLLAGGCQQQLGWHHVVDPDLM
jgi:hypothetical protein